MQKICDDSQDYSDFIWNEDLLFYQGNWVYISDSEDLRLCVLQKCHNSSAADHFSFMKTLNLISRHHYWSGLRNTVHEYMKTCDTCQRIKISWVLLNSELKSLKASKHLWTDISLDFITDLLRLKSTADRSDEQSFNAIFTVMNQFIKGTHYISTWKIISAVEFTYLLIQKMMRLHIISKSIMSDCESLFTSNFWTSLSKALSIMSHLTTAYHSQTDEQTEHHNQTGEQYLKAYVNWQQNDWADLLLLAEWAYNNLRNAITEYTSFYAEKNHHSLSWNMIDLLTINEMNVSMLQHAENMKKLHETLWSVIQNAQRLQACYYNQQHTLIMFSIEDMILFNEKNLQTRRSIKKLKDKYYESFKIAAAWGRQIYKLELSFTFHIHDVFHVKLLKKAQHRTRGSAKLSLISVSDQDREHDEFEVKSVLNSKYFRRCLKYLIKWTEYQNLTWEPAEVMSENVLNLMKAFHTQYSFKLRSWAHNWSLLYWLQIT